MLADGAGTKPMLVDVREKAEFDVSHLPNAIHAKDTDAIRQLLEATNVDEAEQKIVLYCSVGYRSAQSTMELLAAGSKNVFNLDGSIFQWFNEGRTVYRSEKSVAEVHPFSKLWGLLITRKSER